MSLRVAELQQQERECARRISLRHSDQADEPGERICLAIAHHELSLIRCAIALADALDDLETTLSYPRPPPGSAG